METVQYWLQGFSVATMPVNLLYSLIGCILGTLIGVLPGLGPAAGTAILIPVTFNLDPIGGDHHARGHLLRSDVRRNDYLGPGQRPGRGRFGDHLPGRVSNGQARESGSRLGHCRHRIFHRRHLRHFRPHGGIAAPGQPGPPLRSPGGLFPVAGGPLPGNGSFRKLHPSRSHHDRSSG